MGLAAHGLPWTPQAAVVPEHHNTGDFKKLKLHERNNRHTLLKHPSTGAHKRRQAVSRHAVKHTAHA